MKGKVLAGLMLAVCFCPLYAQRAGEEACADSCVRYCELLNWGWKFRLEPSGSEADYSGVDVAEEDWGTVDLPHDFLIGQPWVAPAAGEGADNSDEGANVRSRLSARGFKEMGVGWYRLHFVPDERLKGRRVLVDFEGMMLVGDAWLNGVFIGKTDYGYLGFEAEVSGLLRWGEENVLAVRTDTRQADNSRWYTGGGLYRDVHLIATDAQQWIARHGLAVTTPQVGDDSATVCVGAEIGTTFDSKTKRLSLHMEVLDAENRVVAARDVQPAYNAKQKTREYDLGNLSLPRPHLWDVDDPYLYTLRVQLLRADGSVADEADVPFGVRTVEFGPDFGLRLNGRKVLLKGIANHHTLGALGAAAYERAMEKRIDLLKDFGFNHIRCSHNPYSESLLRLCDRKGILVVDELYDKWLDRYSGGRVPWTQLWQENIPEWVKRDRNHPSVILWSLGNELQTYWDLPFADWGVTAYELQKTLLRRYDPAQRLITVAMHPRGRDPEVGDSLPAPLAKITDIQAYNYRYMYFPGDGQNFPYMIFYQSEANTAMLGPNWFEMDLDRVVGSAYWGAIDYLGESGGWPAKGWEQGMFDITLQPKPIAYLTKSMFVEEPVVHAGVFESGQTEDWNGIRVGANRVSENWNRRAGDTLSIVVYTNAEEVDLLLNGKSLGRQSNPQDDPKRRNQLRWEGVVWEEGTLTAVARNAGEEVARHSLQSTGEAVALRLEADNEAWTADGLDLQHVCIEAVDKKGRRVRTAKQLVQLAVDGEATLVAVGNGDMTNDDLNVGNTIHLAEGSALAILRSARTPDNRITLTATADGLKSATLSMKTTHAAH